jgi:soluble lytic murein transglycosylase-like protein
LVQVLRCVVLAGIVLVFGSLNLQHVESLAVVAIPTARLAVAPNVNVQLALRVARERHFQLEQPPPPAPPAPAPPAVAPANKVVPPSVPKPTGDIQLLIWNTFAPLGSQAQAWALRVAYCESRYHPTSVNSSSGAMGLFQFLPSTWAFTPYASQSAFDPVANAQAALWLYKRDGPSQWSCK